MSTIVEIAKKAGVSHQLVSKVLHGGESRTRASKETSEKIKQIAQELEYRPHRASQALRKKSFNSVGVIIGGEANAFYIHHQVLASFTQKLSQEGYTVTLVGLESFDPDHIRDCELLKSRMVDLLLISYVLPLPPSVLESIQATNLPSLWLMRNAKCDAVQIDEAEGSRILVRHLAEMGHRQITYVNYTYATMYPSLESRLWGFENAAKGLGIETSRRIDQHVPRADRFMVTRTWLEESNRPKAIIADSIATAQMIIQTAIYIGLRVPEDLAVVSFDESTQSDYLISIPVITSAVRSNLEFGVTAADMALEKLKNPSIELSSRVLPYHLRIGGSTCKLT